MTAAVIALLALWFALSVLAQLPQFQKAKARWRHFGLLPTWQFFTSPLAARDLRLMYRAWNHQMESAEWHELRPGGGRGWSAAIWNPQRRFAKMLLDIATEIVALKVDGRASHWEIERSGAFVTLLELVRRRVPIPPGAAFQVSLCIEDKALFVSEPRQA